VYGKQRNLAFIHIYHRRKQHSVNMAKMQGFGSQNPVSAVDRYPVSLRVGAAGVVRKAGL
jgi:hypothetical protein